MGWVPRSAMRFAALAVLALVSLFPAFPTQQRESLLDMVQVQGGTFVMGDTFGGGRSDEKPLHRVTVSSFALSKYEVTVGQFRQFVQATGHQTTAERQGGWFVWTGKFWERKYNASWKNPYFPQTDRDPVVMVSWYDAIAFCNWLSRGEHLTPFYDTGGAVTENWSADGYRLPTEAEWEYVARSGGKDRLFSWGNDGLEGNGADQSLKLAFSAWPFSTWSEFADGYVYTAPVGSFPPNGLGVHDMSGNVWEWCNDWYESYRAEAQDDPRGPASGVTRALRGGSWTDGPENMPTSFRSGRLPDGRGVNSGFRPARSRQ